MLDIELVLRFLFFATRYKEIISGERRVALKKELNEFMGARENNTTEAIHKFRVMFTTTMDYIVSELDDLAFFSLTKSKKRLHFHPAIFDAISVATYNRLTSSRPFAVKDFSDAQSNLLVDPQFSKAASEKTTDPENIKMRVERADLFIFG